MKLELHDIYGHWHVPFWQTRLFFVAAIFMIIIVGAALIYVLYKRYKKQKKIALHQQVLMQLEQLKKQPIQSRDQAQHAYAVITASLKQYFEFYFKKPCMTSTDYQVIQVLQNEPLMSSYFEQTKELFESGTQVKFAQENALHEQVMKHIDMSITIINNLVRARKNS